MVGSTAHGVLLFLACRLVRQACCLHRSRSATSRVHAHSLLLRLLYADARLLFPDSYRWVVHPGTAVHPKHPKSATTCQGNTGWIPLVKALIDCVPLVQGGGV